MKPRDALAMDGMADIEHFRLSVLQETGLLDSGSEMAFDRLTRLASAVCRAPVSLVSLVDADRQYFKSQTGLSEPWASRGETPLTHSFCQHVCHSGEPLVVSDARQHPLVKDNLAIHELGVIAYLGAPLTMPEGAVLGALCAIDSTPREWSRKDIETIQDLAALVVDEIVLRRKIKALDETQAELREQNERFDEVLTSMRHGLCAYDADGRLIVANSRFAQIYKYLPGELKPGLTIEAMMALQCSRGTGPKGAMAEYLEWRSGRLAARQPFSMKVPLQDGRTMSVNFDPSASGGWIATNDDITLQLDAKTELAEREAKYRLLAENSGDVVLLRSLESGCWTYCSPSIEKLVGIKAEDVLAVPMNHWFHPDERKQVYDASHALDAGNSRVTLLHRLRHADGHFIWVESMLRWVLDDDGPKIVTTLRDVTARMTVESEYRDLFRNSIIGLFRLNLAGQVMRANDALVAMLGYENEAEMLAASLNDLAFSHTDRSRHGLFVSNILTEGHQYDILLELKRKNTDDTIWVSLTAWIMRDADGLPAFIDGSVVDVTERIISERKISHMALHDLLTGLPNRTYFLEMLEERVANAAATGARVCMLYLDLDGVKRVNDAHGHASGDEVLKMIAASYGDVIGDYGFLSRLGGDEFAVILAPHVTPNDAEHMAIRLVGVSNRNIRLSNGSHAELGLSIGIAMCDGGNQSSTELLRQSDLAMYEAKKAGRNGYCWFNAEIDTKLRQRNAIETGMRQAIAENRFRLVYQPQYNIETSELIGFEALLRWQGDDGRYISPTDFIPVAESTGLIIPIGDWVMREACRTAATQLPGVQVAVNVSAVQLKQRGFLRNVVNALRETGLPPSRLEIEITETLLVESERPIIQTLLRLRRLGVRIALDDFGTGYSSLAYLTRFPFDKIKIDRSFVSGHEASQSEDVLRAIIGLGMSMGKQVIAEGIETPQQQAALLAMGCRLGQGYLFGRPMGLEAASHLVMPETGTVTTKMVG